MYRPPSPWGNHRPSDPSDLGDDDPLLDDPKESRPRLKASSGEAPIKVSAALIRLLTTVLVIGVVGFVICLIDILHKVLHQR